MIKKSFGTCLVLTIFGFYVENSTANQPVKTFNATLACESVKNGTFLKDPSSCNTWIECIDKKPLKGSCPNGLFFNRNTNKCVDPRSIECYSTKPCASATINGSFVADSYSFTSYYYCSKGVATLGKCSSGLTYNPVKKLCLKNYACPVHPSPDSWCNIIPDGKFFANSENCQKYHLCENGILKNGSCPEGYYFDAFKSICDFEENVNCPQHEFHKLTLSGNKLCQSSGQFLSDNKTCSGYYYCQLNETSGNFEMIWNNCSNGRFFVSSNGGKCGYRRDVKCKFDRCDGMGLKGIQLVNTQTDNCMGYLICQDGKQIGQALCPDAEKYFDEDLQRCTSNVVKYPICSNL